jgi:hypothetical protein
MPSVSIALEDVIAQNIRADISRPGQKAFLTSEAYDILNVYALNRNWMRMWQAGRSWWGIVTG